MQRTKILGPTVLAVRGTGGRGAVLTATASASRRLTLVWGWGRNCWKGIYHSLHNARDVIRSEGMGSCSSSFGLCRLRDTTSSGGSLRSSHTWLWACRQCGGGFPLLLPTAPRWRGCLLASRPSFWHNK